MVTVLDLESLKRRTRKGNRWRRSSQQLCLPHSRSRFGALIRIWKECKGFIRCYFGCSGEREWLLKVEFDCSGASSDKLTLCWCELCSELFSETGSVCTCLIFSEGAFLKPIIAQRSCTENLVCMLVGDDLDSNCAFAVSGAALEYYGYGKNARVPSGVI